MIAAVQSQDPVMMQTFTSPETIVNRFGKTVANPDADLHTQTCAVAFASAFKEADGSILNREDWVARAKDESKISLPGAPRDYGKFLAAA